MSSEPILSVIVAAQEGEADPEGCVRSLRGQTGLEPGALEIVVVDGRGSGRSSEVSQGPTEVVSLAVSPGESLPRLLAAGIRASGGRLVAMTESHVIFPPDWASRAMALQAEKGASVIGGAVSPGEVENGLDWALLFCDYGSFLPPFVARPSVDLPGCNIVFEQGALPDAADMEHSGFWKTFHCHELARQGASLWLDPRLEVTYNRRLTAAQWLRRRWNHGRCFGGMRGPGLTVVRRMALAVLAPLLPALLLSRVWRAVWRRRRFREQFLRSLPFSVVSLMVWVAGEWTGNLLGVGKCCERV